MRWRSRALVSAAGVLLLGTALGLLHSLRASRPPRSPDGAAVRSVAGTAVADRVLIVSLDGVSSGAVQALGPLRAPVLHQLAARGSWTWNARADAQSTETLPNHASMVTGLTVAEHHYRDNTDEALTPGLLVGQGLFEVITGAGRVAALVTSKSKLRLLAERWPGTIGEVDVAERDDTATVEALRALLGRRQPELLFVHLASADRAGHAHGWDGPQYAEALARVDELLGTAVDLVERLPGRTAIVVTSDHGGSGDRHDRPADPACYTVPLVVVVPGLTRGLELYALNVDQRADPGLAPSAPRLPPIRSAEIANLALGLLGLGAVPGSTVNADQDLRY